MCELDHLPKFIEKFLISDLKELRIIFGRRNVPLPTVCGGQYQPSVVVQSDQREELSSPICSLSRQTAHCKSLRPTNICESLPFKMHPSPRKALSEPTTSSPSKKQKASHGPPVAFQPPLAPLAPVAPPAPIDPVVPAPEPDAFNMSSIKTELANNFLEIDIEALKEPTNLLDVEDMITLRSDVPAELLDVAFNSLYKALSHHQSLDTNPTEFERSVMFHSVLVDVHDWIVRKFKLRKRKDLCIAMETNLSMPLPDNRPLKGYADYSVQRDATKREIELCKDEEEVPPPAIQFTSKQLILVIEMKRSHPYDASKQSTLYLERVKRNNKFKKVSIY